MTEHELHKLCVDIWKFYNEEMLFLFRSLKFILTAAENQNCHYSVNIIAFNSCLNIFLYSFVCNYLYV